MALPASGQISLSQVNTELGNASTAQINMGSAAVRGLFGIASGAIKMSDGYGKSSQFAFSITSNQTNANLRTLALNAGWDGSSAVEATINSGVIITGNTAGNSTAAMTIDGSWPGGVTIINNGVIVGRGGNGGDGGKVTGSPSFGFTAYDGSPGNTGGRALLVTSSVSINNAGTIAGGGGGGGGGAAYYAYSGGGGGGGRSSLSNSSGGGGGEGVYDGQPGGGGTFSSAGSGGASGGGSASSGGAGGNWGSSGANGGNSPSRAGGAGGAAGQAANGNSNITWIATGTRLGPIV